jgi:hypothetical protein
MGDRRKQLRLTMTLGALLLGMGLNSLMAKVEVLAETSQNIGILSFWYRVL